MRLSLQPAEDWVMAKRRKRYVRHGVETPRDEVMDNRDAKDLFRSEAVEDSLVL